ncbi:hypothetical protein GCM10009000_033220 [Halobacterium noricense]
MDEHRLNIRELERYLARPLQLFDRLSGSEFIDIECGSDPTQQSCESGHDAVDPECGGSEGSKPTPTESVVLVGNDELVARCVTNAICKPELSHCGRDRGAAVAAIPGCLLVCSVVL